MSEPPHNIGSDGREGPEADAAVRRAEPSLGNVRMFLFQGSDAELLRRLRDRMPGAVTFWPRRQSSRATAFGV
jgi:hypothetical protein